MYGFSTVWILQGVICPFPNTQDTWLPLEIFLVVTAGEEGDWRCYQHLGAFLVSQTVKDLPTMQETWVQSLGLENFHGEGNGNPLQFSFLENPMDRGA